MVSPGRTEETRGPIQVLAPEAFHHSDAADMGYGGTLHTKNIKAGVAGIWIDKGVWRPQERAGNITLRELQEIRKLLMGPLGDEVRDRGVREL